MARTYERRQALQYNEIIQDLKYEPPKQQSVKQSHLKTQ